MTEDNVSVRITVFARALFPCCCSVCVCVRFWDRLLLSVYRLLPSLFFDGAAFQVFSLSVLDKNTIVITT